MIQEWGPVIALYIIFALPFVMMMLHDPSGPLKQSNYGEIFYQSLIVPDDLIGTPEGYKILAKDRVWSGGKEDLPIVNPWR